jgi:hypothetical protein
MSFTFICFSSHCKLCSLLYKKLKQRIDDKTTYMMVKYCKNVIKITKKILNIERCGS